MKRRDLIKSTILSTIGAMTLSGCHSKSGIHINSNINNIIDNNIVNDNEQNDILDINPKQTSIYEISTVLPFNYKLIDEIAELNQKYKKSRIITLYNNIPKPCTGEFNEWAMILRGENEAIKDYQDFIKYANYAKKLGFEICYLFNSPKPFSKDDYLSFKKPFEKILDTLWNNDIKHIKFGNTQVATLINDYDKNKEFTLSASTALEYHNISQYINLIENYPNIKLIDISIDENHNFRFLKNLKKLFPNIKIELMTNEVCNKGCPARISHVTQMEFIPFNCMAISRENPIHTIFKMPAIYPWDLEYYSAININNFKITSTKYGRVNLNTISYLKNYLNCIEYGIQDYMSDDFLKDVFGIFEEPPFKNMKLSHLKPYLHDIRYFIKHGDKCASRCGSECRHCDKMAARLEEFLRYL